MPDSILVVKESGEREEFDEQKIRSSLIRIGVSGKKADEVLSQLKPSLKNGISTKKIYRLVFGLLNTIKPEVSHKFNLKRALLEIGPAGYHFEDFISNLFVEEGFDTKTRQVLTGKCITHEIDVVASKGKDIFMVECKYHNEAGMKCHIQTGLYVYARYLDLVDGAKRNLCPKFTNPWLITNTKFSEDVIRYAECIGYPLLGWKYPFENSLESIIDRTKCYPISVLQLSLETRNRLLDHGFITVSDLPTSFSKLSEMSGLPLMKSKEILERAEYARK